QRAIRAADLWGRALRWPDAVLAASQRCPTGFGDELPGDSVGQRRRATAAVAGLHAARGLTGAGPGEATRRGTRTAVLGACRQGWALGSTAREGRCARAP